MAVSLATWPGLRVGRLVAPSDSAPRRHEAADTDLLRDVAMNPRAQLRQRLAFGTGLLFALPGMRWRAVEPISRGLAGWLMAMCGIGLLLLALLGADADYRSARCFRRSSASSGSAEHARAASAAGRVGLLPQRHLPPGGGEGHGQTGLICRSASWMIEQAGAEFPARRGRLQV